MKKTIIAAVSSVMLVAAPAHAGLGKWLSDAGIVIGAGTACGISVGFLKDACKNAGKAFRGKYNYGDEKPEQKPETKPEDNKPIIIIIDKDRIYN